MKNILKLAKKFSKTRKFRLLVAAAVAKVLISALVLLALGYWTFQAEAARAAYGLSPNVKQVKVAGNPTVYYLDHKLGTKKAYQSAAAFLSYGNKWPDVKTVSRQELNKWPDLKLVKLPNDKNIYYLNGNKISRVKSPAELKNLKLGNAKIAVINQTDFLSWGKIPLTPFDKGGNSKTPLTPLDKGGSNSKAGGGPSAGAADSKTGLEIELDYSGLLSEFIPLNSRRNLAAVYNLRALGRSVQVSQITFKAQGVFQTSAVRKVYLTDAAGEFLGEPTELNNRRAMFNFSDRPLIIPAGETEQVKVYADLGSYDNFLNHWLQFSINSASDIVSDAPAVNKFPIAAGQFQLLTGEVFGQAKADEVSLNAGSKLIIGQSQTIIAKFRISETSGQEGAALDKIILENLGSAGPDEIVNFKLKDTRNTLVAQAPAMENGQLTFDLNNDFAIGKGASWTLLLLADIAGGDNKTVNFNLRDFYLNGLSYGYGLALSKTDVNETFTIGRESVSIFNKELKAGKRTLSAQSGQIMGNFQIRNNNQKIYLQNLSVSLEKTSDAPALSELVYLVNYDTGEIYSSIAGAKLSDSASLSFNNIALKPRQVLSFSLLASLPSGTLSGDKYRIIINKISYKFDGGPKLEDAIALKGNYLTITESSLYVYPNDSLDKNYIKGQKNIKIASFILEAAAGDDLNISLFILNKSGDAGGLVLYENGFSNLRLTINGSRVSSIISKPISTNYVFDNFNYTFRAGGRAELSLMADTEADLKADETRLAVTGVLAASKNSGAASTVFKLNSVSSGARFADSKAEIKALSAGSFAVGQKDNVVGRFSVINSGAEDIRLDSVNIITLSDGFSNSLGFSNLAIVEALKSGRAGTVSRPVAGANKISLGGFTIKTGQTAEFLIKVSASDKAATDSFDYYLSQLKARGKKSGLDVKIQGDPTDFIAVSAAAPADNNPPDDGNSAVQLSWPVASRKVNYGFHDPAYPFRDSVGEHNAIDIDVSQGTAVKAAADGVIIALADNNTTAYDYITIDHGQGIKTTYGHLSVIKAQIGDTVKQGQIIALSGGQPGTIGAGSNTNGPHLHFEVNQNGVDVDPMGFLK